MIGGVTYDWLEGQNRSHQTHQCFGTAKWQNVLGIFPASSNVPRPSRAVLRPLLSSPAAPKGDGKMCDVPWRP